MGSKASVFAGIDSTASGEAGPCIQASQFDTVDV